MKYYDKRLYKIEQEIKTALLILTVFITAFVFGYFLGNSEIKENQLEEVFSDNDVTLYRLEE